METQIQKNQTARTETSDSSAVSDMNLLEYNREAWDAQVDQGNRWTIPVDADVIARARGGDWQIVLTPQKPVPQEWLGNVAGANVLCLASGGGQQAPILAAAGANVTLLDVSRKQLFQDEMVAARDGLQIRAIQGDMANLNAFADESFDVIVHPCANCFVANIQPVWNEAFRVLKPGGNLLTGFCNPVSFLFDDSALQKGVLKVSHSLPYSDLQSISEEDRRVYMANREPLCFGHTLDDQIGGQIRAGFAITGFFEDRWEAEQNDPVSRHIATFAATKAQKP